MSHRDLKVLQAAESAAVLVNQLVERNRRKLIDVVQLQKAAMRVPLNIGEGFGRKSRADREYKLYVARGEAEEVIKALRVNHGSNRIGKLQYWPLHHRYVAIVKMLDALINS